MYDEDDNWEPADYNEYGEDISGLTVMGEADLFGEDAGDDAAALLINAGDPTAGYVPEFEPSSNNEFVLPDGRDIQAEIAAAANSSTPRRDAAKMRKSLRKGSGSVGLALMEASGQDITGEDNSSAMLVQGGGIAASASTLQLQRFEHMEPRVVAGMEAILMRQDVPGIHPVDAAAAREEFAEVIGGDTQDFARQLRVDGQVQVPTGASDLKQVLANLGTTSGAFLERGPGGQMVNTYATAERQDKADEDLMKAIGYVSIIADKYMDDRTRGTSVEPARRRALEEAITKRMIDGTFYQGSKNTLPLPNETGVLGIRPTQGVFTSGQGTSQDRLSISQYDNLYETYSDGQKTKFKRDSNNFKVFKASVSEQQRNEVLRQTPSLANSLFPRPARIKDKTYSTAEIAAQKSDQARSMAEFQEMADFAHRVFKQQMPTTKDESKGQSRKTGWQSTNDELADLQNLRNEAAIQDKDWSAGMAEGNQDATGQVVNQKQGAGSGQGGMHGYTQLSEMDIFIENAIEEKELSLQADTNSSPVQGSKEWLAQRVGKITASTAADLLKEGGVEERALDLAMERLGTKEKFLGNAHTREGTEGEALAAKAFMASQGRGLTLQEAYFEENEKFPGFGVSPDGRLYDKEGESAGLLELKFLSSGSMGGALNKYTPQMQMQMAITGESKTHFYALDKYTGEYVHEVVKANPAMQAELIEAGQAAQAMSKDLDNRGVKALRNKIMSNKPRKRVGEATVKGQQKSFEPVVEVEEEMTSFQAATMAGVSSSGDGSVSQEESILYKGMKKLHDQDTTARAKEAAKAALPDAEIVGQESRPSGKAKAVTKEKFVDSGDKFSSPYSNSPDGSGGQGKQGFGSPYSKGGSNPSGKFESRFGDKGDEADASKETVEASKEASDSLREFGNQVKKAGAVVGELANLVMAGSKSGMSEERLASEVGLEVENVRGMREAMEMGGMDASGIDSTINTAGSLVTTFNDKRLGATKWTEIMSARGASDLEEVANLPIPLLNQLEGKDAQGLTTMVAGLMEGKSKQARTQIGKIFGMPALATYDQDPASINNVDTSIDGESQRATHRGLQQIEQVKREALEQSAEVLGETGGSVVGAASVASTVAGSATAGYVGSKLAKTSLASRVMAAAQPSANAAKVAKGLSVAAKATPVAIAASAVPMAVRHFGDVKDDGGLADSSLDVLEFASYGATAGALAGSAFFGVGAVPAAMVGGAVGGAVGLVNEAWDWATADDEVVPSANLGNMPSQGRDVKGANKNIVNVEVTNEISPDLIRTTTDVDGDINTDEETGLGTGG